MMRFMVWFLCVKLSMPYGIAPTMTRAHIGWISEQITFEIKPKFSSGTHRPNSAQAAFCQASNGTSIVEANAEILPTNPRGDAIEDPQSAPQ
jgi:hypothetical protein